MAESENKRLTVAVVSDLHFFTGQIVGDRKPSWLHTQGNGMGEFRNRDNPWVSLEKLVESQQIAVDVLICPGDITTWADAAALQHAWARLIDLGKKLRARLVAVATGNHDVSSRPPADQTNVIRELNQSADLIESLKLLSPPYPVHDLSRDPDTKARARRTSYFGDDFILVDDDDRYRILVINTCARHTQSPSEYERGRFAESALASLKEALHEPSACTRKVNILVCHHHPIQHEEHHLGAYDFMLNGQVLLDELCEHGDWIIFHGHKHHARLAYAQGSTSAPVVFAAASLSASLDDASHRMRNQFYIVDIELDAELGPPRGSVRAWNWSQGTDWQASTSMNDGIFYGAGFGHREHPDFIAKRIAENATMLPVPWADLLNLVPELRYVIPKDMKLIQRCLKNRFNLVLLEENDGSFIELAKGT